MLTRSFAFILAFFATSAVFAEEAKPKATGVVVDVTKDVLDHVTVDTSTEGKTVFTLHEGYGVEKVLDGDKTVKTFDLKEQAPKSVTKYVHDNKPYVEVTVEPALHLAFKKDGDNWVEWKLAELYEEVVFKSRSGVSVDLEKFGDEAVFTAEEFGTGKKHVFTAAGKRPNKVTFGDKVLLKGEKEFFLELEVFVGGDKKFARVVYLYKPDGRFKEVFFEKGEKKWAKVKTEAAASGLHSFNDKFPSDYKTKFDGFSVSKVLLAVAAVALSTLL